MQFQPDLCADIPIVGLVGRDYDDLLDAEPLEGTLAADPAGPALIAFTSGTTSNPKGVVHSHQTLGFETRQLLENYPAERGRQLTGTPVGHFVGMLGAFLIPVLEGAPIDLCDVWDPAKVLKLIERDGLSIGGGPPYFVTSVLDHPDCTPEHLRHFTTVGLGGSTVPAAVTRRLADLGMFVFRSYGSSEHPSITGSSPSAPEDKRLYTDGNPRPGVEIRLGADGEIYSRGPDLCLGYTDPELTAKAFDEDGWYRTGDVGVLDDDGYLTITDRKADVIIRGGENISALEVEEVLLAMPQRRRGGRGGRSRRAARRAGGGGPAPQGRARDADARRGPGPLQGGRRGDAEVARGTAPSRRLSAHRERQGAEVPGPAEILR